jgi:hypothetical protein
MRRWPFILLATPVVLWSAYWGAAALALRQGSAAILSAPLSGPLSAQVGQTQVSGFPGTFELSLTDISLRSADDFLWSSPFVQLQAPSYSPQTISLEISSPQRVQSRFGNLDLTATEFQVQVLLQSTMMLALGSAQIDLEEALLSHDAGWQVPLERLRISLQDSGPDGVYTLLIGTTGVDLSNLFPALPPTHNQLRSQHAAVDLSFSRDWDRRVTEAGLPALQGLTIREAGLEFGTSQIGLTGQLQITEARTLEGSLSLTISGWRELIQTLRTARLLDPDLSDLILEFLSDQNANEAILLPLSIRNGQVQLGFFTLGMVPPLP